MIPSKLGATLLGLLQQAVARHQAGDLGRAESLFREALRIDPRQPDALHFLGVLAYQKGQAAEGLHLVERSLKLKPKYPAALNAQGIILGALGRRKEALASFDRAIALTPADAITLNNRANVLRDLGRLADAVTGYERAIAVAPNYAEAIINKANTLVALHKYEGALAHYARGLALAPALTDGHLNQALTLVGVGRPQQALAAFNRAIALKPNHQEAHFQLALALQRLGRFAEAVASFDHALAITPDRIAAWNNRGVSLDRLFNYPAARASFERALEIQPDYPEALINVATRYHNEGRQAEALAALDRRLDADRTDPRARLLRTMYSLPVIYRDEAELAAARTDYADRLETLRREIDGAGDHDRFADVIGAAQPFHLAYQGRNDRDLQRSYGELACRIAAARFAPRSDLPRPTAGERLRIGIVSSLFRKHTVWHLMLKAWVSQFDRARFEVFGYHTMSIRDACTDLAATACDRFVQGSHSVATWRQTILADAPHVILYPEIGMDTVAAQLAAHRLARVQCSSWGHPETSGYPTLDYFLSSDAMEPPDADDAYTEQLVRLPRLGIYYEPAETTAEAPTRADLGLRSDATVFWCCQSLFKYLPRYDDVFPRIARDVPNAQFAFIAYPHGPAVTDIFRARLTAAFARFGLDADRFCVIMPRFDASRFATAFAVCDIVLDTIGWSGGQTTLESLSHNRPIVTMAGPLMRGRHTAAILNLMDLAETVAATPDDYVAIAARLGTDAALRAAISARIAEAQPRLYRDRSAIVALEDFLERAAGGGP